ncbi:MAG: hypothetical protein JO370_02620, partial [Paucibacter sp.]|nr:hypothetical protein [Roseateles sp.]
MAEAFLAALLRQTLLLAMAAVVLLALRRPVLARFGAGLSYARWALLPLTLLAVAMPVARPEQVVVARFVQQFGPAPVATLALPQAPAS